MICHIDLDAFYVQVERVLQRVPLGPTEPCAVVQYSEWKCHMQHEFPSAPVTKWLVVEWSVRWWRARPGLVGRIQLYEFTWITIFPVASCVLCKFGHGWSGEIICQCPTMCVFARPERTWQLLITPVPISSLPLSSFHDLCRRIRGRRNNCPELRGKAYGGVLHAAIHAVHDSLHLLFSLWLELINNTVKCIRERLVWLLAWSVLLSHYRLLCVHPHPPPPR